MPDFKDRLHAFIAANERLPIRAEQPSVKGDDTTAVLRLYDPVDSWGGSWGVSAKEFAAVLDELPDTTETIELHINSPGGEAFEGIAVLNLLRQHDARYVAVVDGVAASAASFIAAGADELVMARNSELFVHRAWGLVVGNADDMTKFAGELDHLDRNLASIYADKAGGTVDEWLTAMSDETWYSAEEAVADGLADRVDEGTDASQAKARHDLSIFRNSGRRPAPAPTGPRAEEGGSSMDPVQLRTSLGLAEDATDEQVAERLAALAVADKRATTAEARVAELEEQPPGVPDGFELVPKGTGEQLTAASDRIKVLEDKEHVRERDAFVAKWHRKFSADARAEIEKTYDTVGAEALAALLEKSPDVLPLDQIGHGGSADLDSEQARADADYKALFGEEVPA